MSTFENGTKLSLLVMKPAGKTYSPDIFVVTPEPVELAGSMEAASEIEVTMEAGQMAGVPWARVVLHADGSVRLFNLAHAHSVELASAKEPEAP